jgi:hypothetical protein
MSAVFAAKLFPFCITPAASEPEAGLSSIVTQDWLVELVWRVKKWKAVFQPVDGGTGDPVEVISSAWNYEVGEFDTGTTDLDNDNLTDEKELLCLAALQVCVLGVADLGISFGDDGSFAYLPLAAQSWGGNIYYEPYKANSAKRQCDIVVNGVEFNNTEGYSDECYTRCVVTPYEYWEYDPGDGPIWNSTTGAQIRDPFSVQS